ncbi:ABC transporter permease [Hydrogenophaga borbori]
MPEAHARAPGPWRALRAAALPLLLLGLFEALARRAAALGSEQLAPPSAALRALLRAALDGSLWPATGFTLGAAALGLLIGAGLGTLVGIGLGLSPRASRAGFLSIELLRPLPPVALLPLVMLLFGFGTDLEVSLVAFSTFWPQVLLVQSAVRQVDPQLLELGRLLGLSTARRIRLIVLPAIAPRLLTAVRMGTGFSLVIALTVEIAGNPQGMGFAMLLAQQSLEPAMMIGWLMWIGAIGVLVNTGMLRLQRALNRRLGVTVP